MISYHPLSYLSNTSKTKNFCKQNCSSVHSFKNTSQLTYSTAQPNRQLMTSYTSDILHLM